MTLLGSTEWNQGKSVSFDLSLLLFAIYEPLPLFLFILNLKRNKDMCCPLEQIPARFTVQSVAVQTDKPNKPKIIYVKGIVDRRPSDLLGRLLLYCNHMERLEKIAEIVDEFFHLFQNALEKHCSFKIYEYLEDLHHAAHHIEHTLHSFCFIGDILRIISGNFLIYQNNHRKKIDLLRSMARICHATAHFFATTNFLFELDIINLSKLRRGVKFIPVFGSVGYGIVIISLIWECCKNKSNSQFKSDLTVHLSGLVFDAIPIIKGLKCLPLNPLINKLSALSGIVHAWAVINRLFPFQDHFSTKFYLPREMEIKTVSKTNEKSHCSHFDHHHVHYYPVPLK